jgi:DNA-binding LacI/PurR family transcriptional regulator
MAQAAYEEVRKHGLRIPEDISITGFDNISIGKLLYPQLTTVAEPIETMARLSVELLLNRINNRNAAPEPQHIFVKHKFIERDSVATITTC